ncbi:MAG TPA: hypothetical protein VEK34_11070 [Methylocella sp.]|nr:hypothetical protein [Methylocella sp.]
MSKLPNKRRRQKQSENERLRTAQSNLQRMLETIAPYSHRPINEDEPPLRWVGIERESEIIQNDI